MLKRLKPIINTGFFLKIFFPPNSTSIEMQPFEHHLFITFPKPQLDHPYQQSLLTKTAMFNALNRGRVKIRSPSVFSRSKTGRAWHRFCWSCVLDQTQMRKVSDGLAPALLAGLSGPRAPMAALQQIPPMLPVGFGAGSQEHAEHYLLGTINVVFVTLRQWIKLFLPKICS